MAGTESFLWQIVQVLGLAALFSLSLWQKLRGRRRVPFVVPFGFAVGLVIATSIFVRQASGVYRLGHLRGETVSSISYGGKTYRQHDQIDVIVDALNKSQWWSSRSSDMVQPTPFSIHFLNGTEWTMVVGSNRYGSGTIIRMADREFSRGYAFNPGLNEVLQTF